MSAVDIEREETKVRQRGEKVARPSLDVMKFVREYAAWLGIAVPFAIHMGLAMGNMRLGYHEVVPVFADISGADLMVLLRTYATLFVRPETWAVMARLYALWTVAFLVLSVCWALRADTNILSGVTLFAAHGLAAVLILAVITPALWVLLAGWGPGVVELAPPLVLGFIGVLLTVGARNASG